MTLESGIKHGLAVLFACHLSMITRLHHSFLPSFSSVSCSFSIAFSGCLCRCSFIEYAKPTALPNHNDIGGPFWRVAEGAPVLSAAIAMSIMHWRWTKFVEEFLVEGFSNCDVRISCVVFCMPFDCRGANLSEGKDRTAAARDE